MTVEEELIKFRNQERRIQKGAMVPVFVIGGFLIVAVIALTYASYLQYTSHKRVITFQTQLLDAEKALRAFEEKAEKFYEIAKYQAEHARRISEECQQKTKTSK